MHLLSGLWSCERMAVLRLPVLVLRGLLMLLHPSRRAGSVAERAPGRRHGSRWAAGALRVPEGFRIRRIPTVLHGCAPAVRVVLCGRARPLHVAQLLVRLLLGMPGALLAGVARAVWPRHLAHWPGRCAGLAAAGMPVVALLWRAVRAAGAWRAAPWGACSGMQQQSARLSVQAGSSRWHGNRRGSICAPAPPGIGPGRS